METPVVEWERDREGKAANILSNNLLPLQRYSSLHKWFFIYRLSKANPLIWGDAAVSFIKKILMLSQHSDAPYFGLGLVGLWFLWHLWTIYIPVVEIYITLKELIPSRDQEVLLMNGPVFAHFWACWTQLEDSLGKPDTVVSSWL